MNLDPEIPRSPKIPEPKKTPPSFERLLNELKPKLEKHPPEQRLPALPPDQLALESVQEWVRNNGMLITDTCPPTIAVGGEFLDRSLLREGRVGQHGNFRVATFLYRYADNSLRAVIIYPRDGVDARELGKAIFWGQVADVPEHVAQTQIKKIEAYFEICAFRLSELIDLPALERFKSEFAAKLKAQWSGAQQSAASEIASLKEAKLTHEQEQLILETRCQQYHQAYIAEHNRAELWKLVGGVTVTLGIMPWLPIVLPKLREIFLG